VKALIIQEIKL